MNGISIIIVDECAYSGLLFCPLLLLFSLKVWPVALVSSTLKRLFQNEALNISNKNTLCKIIDIKLQKMDVRSCEYKEPSCSTYLVIQ